MGIEGAMTGLARTVSSKTAFRQHDQPLPTLCASYTVQHLLALKHVQARGLFTFLQRCEGGYAFFDPGMFCGVAMHAVGQMNLDPLHAVRQAWSSRMNARNTVALEH